MPIEKTKFWARVVEACGTEEVSKIAAKAKSTPAGIYKWRDGGDPGLESIVNLSDSTGVALHWLLFNEGPRYRRDLKSVEAVFEEDSIITTLAEPLKQKVIDLAFSNDLEIGDEAAELIKEALLARGEITDQLEGREVKGALLIDFGEYAGGKITVPLLGEIAAGEPLYISEEIVDSIEIPAIYKLPGRDVFVLRAHGDSLIDEAILDGDLLVCAERKRHTMVS